MERAPTHPGAYERLCRAYRASNDHDALIRVMLQRAEALASSEEQATLFQEAAVVAHQQAGDASRAMPLYRKVLDRLTYRPQPPTTPRRASRAMSRVYAQLSDEQREQLDTMAEERTARRAEKRKQRAGDV